MIVILNLILLVIFFLNLIGTHPSLSDTFAGWPLSTSTTVASPRVSRYNYKGLVHFPGSSSLTPATEGLFYGNGH